jgi:hypothetical protein
MLPSSAANNVDRATTTSAFIRIQKDQPAVNSRMRDTRYRGDCCRSCLRGSLRGLNYLLAIIGVLMTAYALFMYVQWSEAIPEPPVPPELAPVPASPSEQQKQSNQLFILGKAALSDLASTENIDGTWPAIHSKGMLGYGGEASPGSHGSLSKCVRKWILQC